MKRYTANVIIPDDVYPDRLEAALLRHGYEVEVVGSGAIVQGVSPTLEKFIADLEQRIPPNAVIDDFGEAGGQNSAHRYAGRRFKLVAMGEDPDPVPAGSTGVVDSAVDWGGGRIHLNVTWDPEVGRSLNLELPVDKVEWL